MTTTDILKGRLENKPGVRGATAVMRSGRYFDFIDPQPDQFTIEDLAWGLADTIRFGGQQKPGIGHAYNVAQHSVLGAMFMERDTGDQALAYQFLMHDAHEGTPVGDMVGPLKQLCPDYKAIEKRSEAVVLTKYGLPTTLDPRVKVYDLRMLHTEQRDLTAGAGDSWNGLDDYAAFDVWIVPWSRHESARIFLAHYDRLSGLERF